MATHLDLQEQEQIDQIKHFWSRWGGVISGGLLVIMVCLAAWNGYQFWQNRQAQQAAVLLEAVEFAVEKNDLGRVQQAAGDLQTGYGGTAQAAQGGLLAARVLADAGKWDEARSVLAWIADKATDEGHQALARLRLAGVLIEQKAYDDALAQLSARFPAGFTALVADRKGDVLALQDKKAEAIAEYRRAWEAFATLDARAQYRFVIEAKLNSLGVRVDAEQSAGGAA